MGQLFADERGQALRVTWHSEADVVVLSLWRADRCVGTVRLSPGEARRLGAFLARTNRTPGTDRAPGTQQA